MIHLNVRTAYSLLQSTIRLEQYVLQMTERGSRSVAIADDAFYGVPTFLSYCQRYEVKPLIGLRTVLRLDGVRRIRDCVFIKRDGAQRTISDHPGGRD